MLLLLLHLLRAVGLTRRVTLVACSGTVPDPYIEFSAEFLRDAALSSTATKV
jgi:hypothetical protein